MAPSLVEPLEACHVAGVPPGEPELPSERWAKSVEPRQPDAPKCEELPEELHGGVRRSASAELVRAISSTSSRITPVSRDGVLAQGDGSRSCPSPQEGAGHSPLGHEPSCGSRVLTPGSGNAQRDAQRATTPLSSATGSTSGGTSWQKRSIRNISFSDATVLRSSSLSNILKNGGAVLDCRHAASPSDYETSSAVDHVRLFVSHNWSSSGRDKFLVLLLHTNLNEAFACALLVSAVPLVLTAVGALPTIHFTGETGDFEVGLWCQIVGFVTFMAAVSCWHDVRRLVRCSSLPVFLDKTCVSQTDSELKQKGIEHIAAILYYSWSMLVCYTDMYLQRLWTVYEVASFMMLHPGGCVHVRPATLAKFSFGSVTVFFVFNMLWHILHLIHVQESMQQSFRAFADMMLTAIVVLPFVVVANFLIYGLANQRVTMAGHIQRFRFADAQCEQESDRYVILRNIVAFMRWFGHVNSAASDDFAIEAFERMVRAELPQLFAASLGRAGFPHHLGVLCVLPYIFQCMDYIGAQIYQEATLYVMGLSLVWRMTNVIASAPLTLALCVRIAECCIRSPRVGYTTTVAIMSTAMLVFGYGGLYYSQSTLYSLALQGHPYADKVLLAMSTVLVAITLAVFWPIRYAKHRRRLSQQSVESPYRRAFERV